MEGDNGPGLDAVFSFSGSGIDGLDSNCAPSRSAVAGPVEGPPHFGARYATGGMVSILVARTRADDLLRERIVAGLTLGDRLAKEVDSKAAYDGWIQDRERWKRRSLDVLRAIYGDDSREVKELDDSDRIFVLALGTPWHLEAERALERHESSLNVLRSLQEGLDLAKELPSADSSAASVGLRGKRPPSDREHRIDQVFIVHGHDDAAREAAARQLEQSGYKVVILHEQPNRGRTLIEKFEQHAAEAGYAVILLTEDDVGGPSHAELRPRARQNVVFEMGFFYGLLGRDRVAVLYEPNVEWPSDIQGIVYIELDSAGAWKTSLLRELTATGSAE